MAIHEVHAVHLSRQGTDGSMLSHLLLAIVIINL